MDLRWEGFRRVYGQVEKRIRRRLTKLGLGDLEAYRHHLERHPEEWDELEALCRITISRFYRDAEVFDFLRSDVLPELAERAESDDDADRDRLTAWTLGAASGEEPYSLRLCWDLDAGRAFPGIEFRVLASEGMPHMIERAERACYPASSLRELPDAWRERAFESGEDPEEPFCLRTAFRDDVQFLCHDVSEEQPPGPFDLVACRNLAFTYFDEARQRDFLETLRERLRPGGGLVVGLKEQLPDRSQGFASWGPTDCVFRRVDPSTSNVQK